MITCGHCGCAVVGELKKQQYVYYHCSRYKGRCPEPYTREEVFDDRFSELLLKLAFPKDVMEWLVTALHESHQDEKTFHDEAIGRLQAEYRRLQDRMDAMYVDKLDGRIDNGFFDRKSAEWRAEQDRLLRDVATHQSANRTYIEEGVQLLRLADRAHPLFEKQEPAEKRRLLNFLLSNCVWKDGVLTANYRQPFDMLALAREAAGDTVGGSAAEKASFENWLPIVDAFRTWCATNSLKLPDATVLNGPLRRGVGICGVLPKPSIQLFKPHSACLVEVQQERERVEVVEFQPVAVDLQERGCHGHRDTFVSIHERMVLR